MFFNVGLPELKPLLPILGTIGLILIVLEAGLDLELNHSKRHVLNKSAISALLPIIILQFVVGYAFSYFSGTSFNNGMVNAIPLCIISSAIAIPSVQYLSGKNKEFVIYESSFSDIFGVILFNFFTTNDTITISAVWHFILQSIIMLLISMVASILLAVLIKKVDHRVKFIPIIMMVILIYTVSKVYHLPSLIFILIFGLFLNNLDELKYISFIKKLEPEKLESEVQRFREIVGEITFLVRTMFFLLLGFTIDAGSLLNLKDILIAAALVAGFIIVRYVQLRLTKMELNPLLFIFPRGLITILLFISIPASNNILFVNNSLMVLVVLISTVVMMLGLLFQKKVVPELE